MKIFAYLFAALVVLAGAETVQAQSSSDTYVVRGTVERVDHAANRVFVKGDDGRDYAVDISQGHATGSARTPGQEVTVYGRRTGQNRIEATNITADRDYQGASAADRDRFRPRGWEQLHGTVQDVEGHRMRLRTDDGRTVRVDLSALPDRREEMINHLRNGAVVTVIGDGDSRSDRFYARHVRFDDRDVNRRAWGNQGSGGNVSASGETQIHGKVETIHEDNMRLRTDDGRIIRVDIDPVRERARERFKVGDEVTVVGTFTGDRNRMTARTVRVDRGGSSGGVPSGEQRISGKVETIHEDNMRLRTDDGRIIRVDIDPVRERVRERFKVGDEITVVGTFTGDRNRMTARTLRVDRGGQPSSGGVPSGEQRISGKVEAIHEDNMRLRADDGRIIRVDIDPVRDRVRERFKVGDHVTVVGTFTGDRNRMTARTVRVEGSPAASPATNRPRNADDCKDRGWQNYNNPSFKNQGDCVSYVNSRKK